MDAAHAQDAGKRCFARVLALPYEDKPSELGLAKSRAALAHDEPRCAASSCRPSGHGCANRLFLFAQRINAP